MKYFDFNPFGTEYIVVRFECDNCSNQVESEGIYVPTPNYMADNNSDSQTDNDGYAVCEECKKEFDIDIFVTFAGGDGQINDLPEEHSVDVEEILDRYYGHEYDAIFSNTEFLQTCIRDLDNILKLLAIEPTDDELKKIFHRQLYTSVIGIMETYLSDAFINTVFESKENLKQFFKTYKVFEKQQILISSFFDFEEKVEAFTKKELLGIIYHHLPKVAGMYKDTFNVKFPEFGEVYKAVLKRHDFVHRNGKDKDGNVVEINSIMIKSLVDNIRVFVTEIDDQIKNYAP